jgi:hypothetical protein
VLPQDAVVFLMQADRVLHDRRLAVIVGDRDVEIVDVPEAIAAQRQRIGELAQAVFAGVERALPEMVCGRIGIGHDHVGDAGPIDDRTFACAVTEGDLMQHETFARGPSHAERPVLPAYFPALDGKARAVLLDDVEWPDVLSHRRDRRPVVVSRYPGNGNDVRPVDELYDPVLDQIDQRHHAFDRMGVAVVLAVPAPV